MNMAAVSVTDEVDIEQRQTLWVGGLNEKVTEEILYELFQNVSFSNISTFRIYEVGFLGIVNFIQKKLSTNKSCSELRYCFAGLNLVLSVTKFSK